MKQIKYADYRKIAKTFDVLNFENKDWFWRLIGHTAMVVVNHQYDQVDCWESTSRGLGGQSGVQLNPLKARLESCDSRVFVRRIDYCGMKYWDAIAKLKDYVRANRGIPYPNLKTRYGRWYLIKAALDCGKLTQNVENPKIRFCTDLIAATYRDCGLAQFECASSEFEPDDMRYTTQPDDMTFDDYLVDGVTLGEEMEIVL